MHCYLHVGMAKTGTTRFQSILKVNRQGLSDQRIYVPKTPTKGNHRLLATAFFNGTDALIRKLERKSNFDRSVFFEKFLIDFAADIEAAKVDHDVCIITSEHFSSYLKTPSEIDALKEYLKSVFEHITVICYFREPISAIISKYHNHVKSGGVKSLEDFISVNIGNGHYEYNTLAKNWERSFSRSNCIFRIYERSKLENGDIAKDLLDAIIEDLDWTKLITETPDDNKSLNTMEAAAIRAVNKFTKVNWQKGSVSKDKVRVIKNNLLSLDVLKASKLSTQFHREHAKKLADSNELFFRNFFDDNTSFSIPTLNADNPHQKSMQKLEELIEALIYSVLNSTYGD